VLLLSPSSPDFAAALLRKEKCCSLRKRRERLPWPSTFLASVPTRLACSIDHAAGEYVVGAVLTQTIEGFWSLIKRGMIELIIASARNICRSMLPTSNSGITTGERGHVGTAIEGCSLMPGSNVPGVGEGENGNGAQNKPNLPVPISIIGRDSPEKANPNEPSKKSRRHKHDGFDWINLAILTFTFVAAAIAARQAWRLADLTADLIIDARTSSEEQSRLTRESNNLNREAMIASNRAWIGPREAKIEGPVELEKPIEVSIDYGNSGKEPGLSFRYYVDSFQGTVTDEITGTNSGKIAKYLTDCRNTGIGPGQVVFPSTGLSAYKLTIKPKDMPDQAVIDGNKIVFVQGCFVYQTFNIVRHTYFCFFYKGKSTKPENLNICLAGHYAD
jgi:hypothetical protein